MSTYLVTGGCGFIGSNYVLKHLAAGDIVINIDKLTYAATQTHIEAPNYKLVKADIADKEAVAHVFANNDINYVVNFAAESHVDNSIHSPAEFIRTNVMGTFNMLECAREYYVKNPNFKFLHISTDEVYGALPKDGSMFTEESQYRPNSPYSASKAGSDHLVRAWHKTYGLPVITTNCSNNYGPRQHKEKLIPKVIHNALNGLPITIYGKGENVRDWIYVGDHVDGIDLALQRGKLGETYCFGGDAELTNNEVVNKICEILDKVMPKAESYKNLITYVADRPGHDLRYAIDGAKAKAALGFEPKADFETHITETISWYINHG